VEEVYITATDEKKDLEMNVSKEGMWEFETLGEAI
jgi:hypothetical protein